MDSHNRNSSHVFNAPAKGRPRAEHHRPSPPPPAMNGAAPNISNSSTAKEFRIPSFTVSRKPNADDDEESAADLIEIPRPPNFPETKNATSFSSVMKPRSGNEIVYHPRKETFSTNSSFKPVNAWKGPSIAPLNSGADVVDLTGENIAESTVMDPVQEQMRQADRALGINNSRFGAYDPTNYMDAAQTSENIKALLEGAFEDDEDRGLRRSRRGGVKRAAAKSIKADEKTQKELLEKLADLKVKEQGQQHISSTVSEEEQDEDDCDEEEDDGHVEGLKTNLLPHQIDGLTWMLDKEIGERKRNGVLPKGGILADDMGLGKTIQALSLILSNLRPARDAPAANPKRKIPDAAEKTTLVVAPLALIKQWEGEVKSKIEESRRFQVLVHHGPTRTKRFEDFKKYDLVITTYQTLTSEHESSSPHDDGKKVGCFGIHWYRVILDEAHSIKNRNAKMTKAAYALKSVYRWCLTGTPMQNNLDELQSLIRFLNIKPYNELANWRNQISGPMKSGRGGIAMKRLQYFLKAFMKRRTKDVLKKEGALNFGHASAKKTDGSTAGESNKSGGGFKIVERTVKTLVAQLSENERDFYDKLEARTEKSLDNMMHSAKNDYIGALVLLLRLRQTCNHPELVRANLNKDKDSMSVQGRTNSNGDVDDMADMFGGLSMETKKCDICQMQLNRESIAKGMIRCVECEGDLNRQGRQSKKSKKIRKDKSSKPGVAKPVATQKRRAARRVIDSDDEDEDDEGEWIVSEKKRGDQRIRLGKAGGSDDEDEEGGGEWLGADDSFTDNENEDSMSRAGKFSRGHDDESETKYFSESSEDSEEDGKNDDGDDDESNDSSSDDDDVNEGNMIASTKIKQLIKILDEESQQHKFIVFSEFTSMLDIIEPFLRRHRFRFTRYDGKMRNDDREASLDRLRNDPRTRILLCSLRCGSLGLNLTAASRVVILEPFWNPFVEEQAIDRVHRLNQTEDVVVYRLTIADSVEERILELQEKKRELAKAAIEGGKAVAKLDMQDILQLFKRDAEYDHRLNHTGVGRNYEDLGSGRSNGLLQSSNGNGSQNGKTSPRKPKSNSTFSAAARQRQQNTVPPSLQTQYDAVYGRRW